MVYPLLPAFRDGLGVSLESISRALAGRSLAAALSPFVASLADSRGRKTGMLVGLALFIAGSATVVFWPTFPGFVLALILSGLGKYTFDPAMQAFIGDRVPYDRRGLALTLTELAWSGAFIIGVTFFGWLIARNGWLAPFPLFIILTFVLILLFFLLVPKDELEQSRARAAFSTNIKTIMFSSAALIGLTFTFFASAANESVSLVFGVWLEASFGLQLAALGFAAAVIGIAEIGGKA
jgi:MFS family permease